MVEKFCCQSEEGLKKLEEFLSKNSYLSGEQVPGSCDRETLDSLISTPCRKSYPNIFSWWWNLSGFSKQAREQWGSTKTCQKEEKVCGKPAQNTCDKKKDCKEEDEEIDLFGEDTEDDVKAQEKLKFLADYNKKSDAKLLL